jgi:anti-sigma regulatory factor (Ser/Thr protein kinase)
VLVLEVPLERSELEGAQMRLEAHLREQGASDRLQYKVRLVVDEMAANLMMHGRFDGPAPPLRIMVQFEQGAISLWLDDAAAPFDPRDTPDPDAPPSLHDDKVGGLGLSLVRKMAQIQGYQKLADGWNRTVFRIADG